MTKLEKFEKFLKNNYDMRLSEFRELSKYQQEAITAAFKDRYGQSIYITFCF